MPAVSEARPDILRTTTAIQLRPDFIEMPAQKILGNNLGSPKEIDADPLFLLAWQVAESARAAQAFFHNRHIQYCMMHPKPNAHTPDLPDGSDTQRFIPEPYIELTAMNIFQQNKNTFTLGGTIIIPENITATQIVHTVFEAINSLNPTDIKPIKDETFAKVKEQLTVNDTIEHRLSSNWVMTIGVIRQVNVLIAIEYRPIVPIETIRNGARV